MVNGKRTGSAITDDDIALIRNAMCIVRAITTPPDPNYKSVLVRLRKELDLYANIRPFKPLRNVNSPAQEILILSS